MTDIIIYGAGGKMGQVVTQLIEHNESCRVVAGVDAMNKPVADFPVYDSLNAIKEKADIIIDFSHPSNLDEILSFCIKSKTSVVLCTTGYSDEQVSRIKEASEEAPVFYSRNMSLGANLLAELAKKAAAVLGDGFDIEIIEKHHNQKIDAPSGTALMIADAINDASCDKYNYVYDRHAVREKRKKNELGLHAVRGGTIVGEHEVIFAGHSETLTLSHSAQSKELFAAGAVCAAIFMKDKAAGLYDMGDLL